MGRRGLGVSESQFKKMPHAKEPPPSLWWYRSRPGSDDPTSNTERVIDEYLYRYRRGGRKPPNDFRSKILMWLYDLSREQKIAAWADRPRAKRYWTIPAYALANKLPKATLAKRLRELEGIAIELFPDKVPSQQERNAISDEQKARIRARYIEILDMCEQDGFPGDDHTRAVAMICEEFKLKPFRVGQICKPELDKLKAQPTPTLPETTATPPRNFGDDFGNTF